MGGKKSQEQSQQSVDREFAERLLERAKAEGVDLAGPGGLLQQVAKRVLETGLEVEMSEHLGYDKHDSAGRNGGNSCNGTRAKTVTTDVGPVQIAVPRDRDGSFEPRTVRKRQRRLTGVDELVISLAAKGLTTGEIAAHLAEVYGAEVSKDKPGTSSWPGGGWTRPRVVCASELGTLAYLARSPLRCHAHRWWVPGVTAAVGLCSDGIVTGTVRSRPRREPYLAVGVVIAQ